MVCLLILIIGRLMKILEWVQYDQVIAHVANQKVSINLDD
ncbi:BREX-1 system adenine-specific DNA-methyltransferase PglX [Clostridium estertheticum]|nr:BREX-1 system adenine-specific DNA-methyltransferase PglX [Clostridium estertheticum]